MPPVIKPAFHKLVGGAGGGSGGEGGEGGEGSEGGEGRGDGGEGGLNGGQPLRLPASARSHVRGTGTAHEAGRLRALTHRIS